MKDIVENARELKSAAWVSLHPEYVIGDIHDMADEIERLRAAISDNLPGLSLIDDGEWKEYSGDLLLKEDQWNAICSATRNLRIALSGGEAIL